MSLSYSDLIEKLPSRVSPATISIAYLRHYICDFIEIYSFFYKENVTKAEIRDLFDDYDFNLAKVCGDSISELSEAEINDRKEEEITYLFQCLEYRQNLLSINYPFLIINQNSIKTKSTLTNENYVYLVFLFASNLHIFKEYQSQLTSEFEYLVYQIIKNFFPTHTIIKQFGKNSDYTGTAREKIRLLASDMNISLREEEVAKIRGNQEKGLDIIAWVPFKDKSSNMLVYMFQCACGKDWVKKFSETRRYSAYFDFYQLKPIAVMAISYALNIMGDFEKSDDIVSSESLLFDRLRLMEFCICSPDINLDSLESISLIKRLEQESLNIEQ